jgi:hypothetical protein
MVILQRQNAQTVRQPEIFDRKKHCARTSGRAARGDAGYDQGQQAGSSYRRNSEVHQCQRVPDEA